MNTPEHAVESQPFRIIQSAILKRIEIALHVVVLIALLQLIDWPYVLLFLALFLLLTWRFFHKYYIRHQYAEASQIQWVKNPAGLRWVDAEQEILYPAAQVKILMTRWFILLQLGKGRSRVSRLLLADSFDSSQSFSRCRKIMIQAVNHAS